MFNIFLPVHSNSDSHSSISLFVLFKAANHSVCSSLSLFLLFVIWEEPLLIFIGNSTNVKRCFTSQLVKEMYTNWCFQKCVLHRPEHTYCSHFLLSTTWTLHHNHPSIVFLFYNNIQNVGLVQDVLLLHIQILKGQVKS